MAQSEQELEKLLSEDGNALLSPPTPVPDLLNLLDRLENALARVEQSPSDSMKKALSPSTKALISDTLFRHSDVDVKVSVASCISEITRITAPDAPYDDDEMKEVFKLIVSSFELLHDKASRSYSKRISILETVAKVRSCVVMLDLECDALLVEMFRSFFRVIRDDHPKNVFHSMETIMNLVLEESEDISSDLLSSLLDVLKTQNKNVRPVARQLAEQVVEKCASKLKPYLLQALNSGGLSLNDYSKVVANACDIDQEALEPNHGDTASRNVVGENDLPPEKAIEVAMETLVDAPTVGSPKSMSNGTLQKDTVDSTARNTHPKQSHNEEIKAKPNDEPANTVADPEDTVAEPANTDAEPANTDAEPANTDAEPANADAEPAKTDAEPAKTDAEPMETDAEPTEADANADAEPTKNEADDEKEVINESEDQDKNSKEVDSANVEEPVIDATASDEKKIRVDAPDSPRKMSENDGAVSSPSCSENVAGESDSKTTGGERKDESDHVNETKEDNDYEKEYVEHTEGTGVSDNKASSSSEKEDEILDDNESNKEEDEMTEVVARPATKAGKKGDKKNEDELKKGVTKPAKKSGKKVDIDSRKGEDKKKKDDTEVDVKPTKKSGKKVEYDSSEREEKNKGKLKGSSAKDVAKTSSKSSGKKVMPKAAGTPTKDESDVEKTVKGSSKRKRSPDEETESEVPMKKTVKASKTKEYGAELIGTKVKVWWPHDKAFYEGVVDSFDAVKKKHKIVYNDGDIETLKLAKERWAIVDDEHSADEAAYSLDEDPEESAEAPRSKKVKVNAEQGSKQGGKGGTSSKKGDASSSKSKATTPKSSLKKKDDVKSKSKVESSKSGSKSKDSKSGKKSSQGTPKSAAKPKAAKPLDDDEDDSDDDDEVQTIKGSNKSNQGSNKSMGKSPNKSGSKSGANGSGKVKAAVVKDSEDENGDSDSEMSLEQEKPVKVNTPKSQKGLTGAKKRKRSGKN